jgi:alpha-beta hydrolase superfamily lysophospholipase
MPLDDPAQGTGALVSTRQPLYFEGLFGWFHSPAGLARDCVAVLCAPVGPEYTRAHRTLRHLADRLAAAGVPCLRFDYEGTGDSAGDEDDADRIGHWRRSIVAAAREARRLSGRERVCLVGVRMGATLAALEAEAVGAGLLVLWNPVVKGRAYARELQAMAMTAGTTPTEGDEGLEAGGFRVSRETLAALRGLDLAGVALPRASRVLLLERDDMGADPSLAERLSSDGIDHRRATAPGWNAMMADHQFTVVPEGALDGIVAWVERETGPRSVAAVAAPGAASGSDLPQQGFDERLARFGSDRHLFGIVSRPILPSGKPAVVLLDAGSIHHSGPHRLYTRLARELALRGHPVLRFDFEGIGDSVLRGAGRENHPYVATAMPDIEAALDHLRETEGCDRFVLVGICSGAYHVFRAGLEVRDAGIERLVAINPWYFHWREGLSLDTTVNHYESVAAYRASARDPRRWMKLLRGEVDLMRLARVGWAHVAKTLRGRWDELREVISPASGTRLSQDLRALAELRRPLHLFQADGEPAETILGTEAALASRRLARAGLLHVERIRGADHTFSRSTHRAELITRIAEIIGVRLQLS